MGIMKDSPPRANTMFGTRNKQSKIFFGKVDIREKWRSYFMILWASIGARQAGRIGMIMLDQKSKVLRNSKPAASTDLVFIPGTDDLIKSSSQMPAIIIRTNSVNANSIRPISRTALHLFWFKRWRKKLNKIIPMNGQMIHKGLTPTPVAKTTFGSRSKASPYRRGE